ncbi:YeaC family protein [Chromohalobacter sarecensis]|uniref:YeaC family protein n=1 Tax=Chromohalobacter sarecensis TaxID=245294 RepID=A0ABV9D3N4_9GAMM|nr:YeaC family protein [Chromohalobacter sarecensis]
MSDMNFDKMVAQMTPAVYDSFKQAIALRKWPDGQRLSQEQTELCLEAVMKYEVAHGIPENERVGYLERSSCSTNDEAGESDAIKWMN